MFEVSFDRLIDAAIDALAGFDEYLEEEVAQLREQVEDYDWQT